MIVMALQLGLVYATPGQFENGGFSRRMHATNVFLPHHMLWKNLKTQQLFRVILDLCLRRTRSGKSHDYRDAIVYEKLCFRNGVLWMVGLTVEIKLRFRDGLV